MSPAPARAGGALDTVLLLPNLVTLLALACGLTAVRPAFDGNYRLVILFLFAEAVLDGLDGRLARLLGATSGMGEQLDSLCDGIGFGVAPAMVTFSLVHPRLHGPMGALAWFAALFYASCVVLRLARFNTLLVDHELPLYHKEFFVGVPAPAAAWLALAPVIAHQAFGPGWWTKPWLCCVWLLAIGVLAFSRVPVYSAKSVSITKKQAPVLLLAAAALIAAMFAFCYITLLVVMLFYLATIPFSVRRFRWLSAHPEAWESLNYRIPRRRHRRPPVRRRPIDPMGRVRRRPRARRPHPGGEA